MSQNTEIFVKLIRVCRVELERLTAAQKAMTELLEYYSTTHPGIYAQACAPEEVSQPKRHASAFDCCQVRNN